MLCSTPTSILFLSMLTRCRAESDGMFECGPHGRFEYCIDGIPGCIIGCHCHPGYYFDTETKICEPNTKLISSYRRQYMQEPTRSRNPTISPDIIQTEAFPYLTTQNIIEEHVNDITKNADDLGDWLYNQFFKTIENQVINNTNEDTQLTRRSGHASLPKHNKLKRRTRKKGIKHKKRQKGLKGKLLRIAEDDSLFQSSESSDLDSSSLYSSQSYRSFESDSDEDHDHKKIILINKKPKPPLPSFIFLPNMNTPFYPPLGLPPPPVLPMYPMVPVPPMMPAPPLLPFQGHIPGCDENTTVATSNTVTFSTTSAATTPKELSVKTDLITTTLSSKETASTEAPAQRSHYKQRKRKRIKSFENIPEADGEPQLDNIYPNLENRQKILEKLRQRINNPRLRTPYSKRHQKPIDDYLNQLIPPDTLMDNGQTDDGVPKSENFFADLKDTSEVDNVDFKYLSQLIHRVKENQTQGIPVKLHNIQDSHKTIVPSEWSKKKYHNFNVSLNSGRRMNQYYNKSIPYEADDSYYSNLGRQIATLIRTIDADKEKVEIEKVQQLNNHPYFYENDPRTFWERSVRSPLKYFHYLKTKFQDPNNSNELLFNIENKVETIATTVPSLSLQEIENMINVIEATRTQFQSNSKLKNVKPSKTFNVNLWPQEIKQHKKSVTSTTTPNIFGLKRGKDFYYFNNTIPKVVNTKFNSIGRFNAYKFTDKINKENWNFTMPRLPLQQVRKNVTKTDTQPLQLKNRRILQSAEKQRHYMNPTILNYKNIKRYFFDDDNHYSFQNDDLRLHFPAARHSRVTFGNNQMTPLLPLPYFHHEINHVDYI